MIGSLGFRMGLEFSSSKKSKRCHIRAKITSPVTANDFHLDLQLHGGWKKKEQHIPQTLVNIP